MTKNQKVARAHQILVGLYFLVIVLFAFGIGNDSENKHSVLIFAVLFFGFLAAVHFFVAKGAILAKPWARVASIVIACFMLTAIPVGTLIGIYFLINTWNKWD